MNGRDCDPSCAEGHFVDYPVKVVLRHIRTRTCGGKTARFYTTVNLNFPSRQSDFASRIPKKLFCT